MTEAASPKKNKRKFKQTKQLVRLTINDGWSQVEIADACRVQQSILVHGVKEQNKAQNRL